MKRLVWLSYIMVMIEGGAGMVRATGMAEIADAMAIPMVDSLDSITSTPHLVRDGIAHVGAENTVLVRDVGRMIVLHKESSDELAEQPVWLLYDNRDGEHSLMRIDDYPWIARIMYAEAFREAKLDYGAQAIFLHNMPVLGNASLAAVGSPFWRSMTRFLYQQPDTLALQYMNNHLYLYPANDDFGRKHGDVFAVNTPYVITSLGSSGSDQSFLSALARTMAALEPETRQFLIEHRLLMPTLQMVLRRSRTVVKDRDDYFSGTAHPVVMAGDTLEVERMVELAGALRPDSIPPVVRLRVISEDDDTIPGIDYFEVGPAEKLFDTVSAVARIARATRYERRMTVSVADTQDPNGRPLTFVWRVLRGDPDRVGIRLLDKAGTEVELRVAWHERDDFDGSGVEGARVDIGVFAHNGTHDSAPAFVTWYFPPHEQREYDVDKRIRSVFYRLSGSPDTYVDPALVTPAEWTDVYRYGPQGESLGWERRRGEEVERFTVDGKLVIETDAMDRPVLAQTVIYERIHESGDRLPFLRQQPGPQRIRYTYTSATDVYGHEQEEPDESVIP